MKKDIKNFLQRNASKKINELLLMDLNPRYTDFLLIDWNEIKEKGNSSMQADIAVKLLEYEEDFTSFKTLLKSLSKGYNQDSDPVICIQDKKRKYIVVEGNRRILASKMLTDIDFSNLVVDKLKERTKNIKFITNSDDDSEEVRENYTEALDSMISLINNLRKNLKLRIDEEIYTQLSPYKEEDFSEEEKNVINSAILERSVTAPGGKLKWPRFQTLTNTMMIFEKSMIDCSNNLEEAYKKTADFLNRSISSIKAEVSNAHFIMILKNNYSGKYYKKIEWKKLKTSAIELSLSTISLLAINSYENLRDFLDIRVEISNRDLLHNNNKTTTEISNFLIDNFYEGNYSTRGWKKNVSKKNLYEFVGIKQYSESFQTIAEKNEEAKAKLLTIKESAEELRDKYQTLIKSMDPNILYNKKTNIDPQIILKKYIKRTLDQEIMILTNDIESKSVETYPYYSLVSIARNFHELFLSFVFIKSDDVKNIVKSSNSANNDFKTFIKGKSTEELYQILYNDFSSNNEKAYSKFVSSNVKKAFQNDWEKLKEIILVNFPPASQYANEMIDKFNGTNFNRVVHRPYWLINQCNISLISELVKDSVAIINAIINILQVTF